MGNDSNTNISIDQSSIDAERDISIIGQQEVIQNIGTFVERGQTAIEAARDNHTFEAEQLARGVTAFARRLKAIATTGIDMSISGPYKGLLTYTLSDAGLFFGRDKAIAELLQRLQRDHLTVLQAESGAGKSSLLQAGVSPQLIRAGHLPIKLRPYNISPSSKLKQAFLPDLNQTPQLRETSLREFLHQVNAVLGQSTTLYVLLDQFEEFFTLIPDDSERTAFVNDLADCLEDDTLNVRWLLALRSEFFGDLANFRPRIRNPFNNDYRLNRLTLAEAKSVIVEPATHQGISFESALVEQLLVDLKGPDNEVSPPQIQLVCSALHHVLVEKRAADSGLSSSITQQMYEEEGRAEGILRGHLNRVLSRTLPTKPERELARQLLLALVSSDRRRIRRTRSNLAALLANYIVGIQSLDDLLAQLVESRLMNVENDEETNETSYELAHDYLLNEIEIDPDVQAQKAAQELLNQEVKSFKRFNTLLTKDRYDIINSQREFLILDKESENLLNQTQNFLEKEAREKEERQQQELEQAQKLAEAQTKQAQIEAHNSQRLRRFTFGLGATLIVALISMLGAFVQTWQAFSARNRADETLVDMSELMSEATGLIGGERADSIVGFSSLQRELFELFLRYQELVDADGNSTEITTSLQRARNHFHIGRLSQKIGDSTRINDEFRLAFDGLKTIAEAHSAPGDVPAELLILINEVAVYYAWHRMDYGEIAEAEIILDSARTFADDYAGDQSAELIHSFALLENAFSRLFDEKNEDEKSLESLVTAVKLSKRATSLDSESLLMRGQLALHLRNLSWTSESLMPKEEADSYREEGCAIARAGDQLPNSGTIFLGVIVSCLYSESFQGNDNERLERLLEARAKLNPVINLAPENVDFKLLRAWVTTRLMDVEKFQDNQKAADKYFRAALADWLDVVGDGETLPLSLNQLSEVYLDLKNHLGLLDFSDETDGRFSAEEKERIFGEVVAAIDKTNDVFGDVPKIALIGADSLTNLAKFQKELSAPVRLDNVSKAIERFRKARIVDDTTDYSERYAWVCDAYETRLSINYDDGNVDSVMSDFEAIRDTCLPIFDEYSFDFYLHSEIRVAHVKTGKLLFDKGRYTEAQPILEYASEWGNKESSELLARMYKEGLGVQANTSRAESLEALATKQSMKKFTVPATFGTVEAPFHVYVYQKPTDYPYKGIDAQVEWLERNRGGTISADVVDSFRKLHALSIENNVSFPELAAYAVGNQNRENSN